MILPALPISIERVLHGYQKEPAQQLLRALQCGAVEWGYPGAADLSDTGVGKGYMDLAAALASGREVAVLCPVAGEPGWRRTFKAFNAQPFYLGTPEGLKGGNRSHMVIREGDSYRWRNSSDIMLILDEAQAFKGMESLASRMIDGAISQQIPIICASATLASSPLELRVAGKITGLHKGGHDWLRFLAENGCEWEEEETRWVWKRKRYVMEQLHHKLIPMRGCRVRKADMGERPKVTIETLALECEEGPQIAAEWRRGLADIAQLAAKKYPFMIQQATRRKIRMRLWKMSEMALVGPLHARMRADLEAGKSVVGFFNFDDSRKTMGKLLKTNAGFYGGQHRSHREHYENEFQAGRIRVLLNQIKAGGSSVSLHDTTGEFPRVGYIMPSDSGVAMGQAPGRLDRDGLASEVQIWIPYVAGTPSENIVRSTAKKIANMNRLNDGAPA